MLSSTCVLPESPSSHTQSVPAKKELQHVCRPGTGLYNTGLPGDTMPHVKAATGAAPSTSSTSVMVVDSDGDDGGPWPGYRPIPVGRHCNWTEPVATTIPDSNTRACTAPLPDGRIFLVGNQIPHGRARKSSCCPLFSMIEIDHFTKTGSGQTLYGKLKKRCVFSGDPLVLSISKDGLNFSEVYALRHCVANSTDGTDVNCHPRFSGGGKLPGFQVRKRRFRAVLCARRNICQDRLGTNMGKVDT